MAYLAAAVSKPVPKETAAVYWDLLGDLPVQALQVAARVAVLESQYPTLPPAGTLRRLATEALATGADVPEPAEAVVLVSRVLRTLARDRGQALAALPALVRQAAEAFGWGRLRDSTDWNVTAAQFRDFYAALARREKRDRLLPESVRQSLRQLAGPEGAKGPRLLGDGGKADG